MAATNEPQPSRGDATRNALIATAIEVFGREGFHAASTRGIAEAAGVNQALIGYHFRNKDGLYLAVFEHIADKIGGRMGPTGAAIRQALEAPGEETSAEARRERYLPLLFQLTDTMIALMAEDEFAFLARLVIREQQAPSPAFWVVYDRVMGPMSDLLTALVARLDPEGAAGDPRLVAATIIGQVLVFRVARAAVMRILDWSEVRSGEVAAIQGQVRHNLAKIFSDAEVIS